MLLQFLQITFLIFLLNCSSTKLFYTDNPDENYIATIHSCQQKKDANVKATGGKPLKVKSLYLESDTASWIHPASVLQESVSLNRIREISFNHSGKDLTQGLVFGLLAGFAVDAIVGSVAGEDCGGPSFGACFSAKRLPSVAHFSLAV